MLEVNWRGKLLIENVLYKPHTKFIFPNLSYRKPIKILSYFHFTMWAWMEIYSFSYYLRKFIMVS